MKFKQLDITGFKSFSEKTTFLIENGLTGIVGPNGCGKSNIVEALRWCMGENSAKSMRGSGMEDVIFSGTSNRASKNISEVCLALDNQNKEGPAQYKEFDEVLIRRKIERKVRNIILMIKKLEQRTYKLYSQIYQLVLTLPHLLARKKLVSWLLLNQPKEKQYLRKLQVFLEYTQEDKKQRQD